MWVWVLLAILLLALAPRVFGGLVLAAILGLVALLYLEDRDAKQREQAEAAAARPILPTQIEIVDFVLDPKWKKLEGRVRNNSPHELESMSLQIIVQDCAPIERCASPEAEGCQCDAVYNQAHDEHLGVPPGEARDFDFHAYGFPERFRGRMFWTYRINNIGGRVSPLLAPQASHARSQPAATAGVSDAELNRAFAGRMTERSVSPPAETTVASGMPDDLPFAVGVSRSVVRQRLGAPAFEKESGYWANTTVDRFDDVVPGWLTLSYLYDTNSLRVRQSEASFAGWTSDDYFAGVIAKMAAQDAGDSVRRALGQVAGGMRSADFSLGDLNGTIERKGGDRIFIAVWEHGTHQR